MVQMNAQEGKLIVPNTADKSDADYKLEMVELFKAGKISPYKKTGATSTSLMKLKISYKWLYDNVALFRDEAKQEKHRQIKQGLVDHTLVADPEINPRQQ